MSTCFSAKTADGTIFRLGDNDGSCNNPTFPANADFFELTVGATQAAENATAITITAAPANLYIPAKTDAGGWFIEFLATGSDVPLLVELDNATAIEAGDTALTVKALPQAIPAGAKARWPVLVRGVTTRNYNRTINTVQSQASSATGFAASTPGQQTAQIDITAEISDTAGYYNLRRMAGTRQSVFAQLIFPQGNQKIKAEQVKGTVYIGSLNRTAQDNNIQTVQSTLNFIYEPVESYGIAA